MSTVQLHEQVHKALNIAIASALLEDGLIMVLPLKVKTGKEGCERIQPNPILHSGVIKLITDPSV